MLPLPRPAPGWELCEPVLQLMNPGRVPLVRPGEGRGEPNGALWSGTLVLWVRPSRTAHAGPTHLGAETRPPRALGAELGHCAHCWTMNRCPHRCRSPLGQAARSLYQLVTGSLSPGMRKGGRGWTPLKQ